MFTTVAYVPKMKPSTPITMMAMSLTIRSSFDQVVGLCSRSVRRSRQGGMMKARAQQAKAPIRLIRSPRSGIPTAIPAGERERGSGEQEA